MEVRQWRSSCAKRTRMTLATTMKLDPGVADLQPHLAIASSPAECPTAPQTSSRVPFSEWTAARLSHLRSCQQGLRSLVDPQVERMFAAFTGLDFCVAWAGPFASVKQSVGSDFCPRLRHQRRVGGQTPPRCIACRRRHWEPRPRPGAGSRRFRGFCGAPTLWIDLWVGGVRLGRVVLQAPAQPSVGMPQPPDFRRALGLLRVLVDRAGAKLEVRQLRQELAAARQLVYHLRAELARLRHELHTRLPEIPELAPPPGRGTRAGDIVDRMLAYVRDHCQKPMSLGEVAQALGMNVSYLSTVFARTTGLAFHAYLDELRLAKAKELLRDHRRPIAQVACECGYASDDWFRHAFKAQTGLSPSAWREAGR